MFIFLIFAVAALALLALFRWYRKNFEYWKHYPLMPSVRGRIFSGNLLDILTFKTNFVFLMKDIYAETKFQNEPLVGIYALKPALLVRDPELIKSILIRDFDCFSNRFSQSHAEDPIGNLSLFLSRYDIWKDQRSKLSPAFSTGKMKLMYPLIQQVGENLEAYLHKQGDRFVCGFKELAYKYTIDTVSTTIFGFCSNSLENPQEEMNLASRKLSSANFRRGINFLIMGFLPELNKFLKPTFFYTESNEFVRRASDIAIEDREKTGIKRNDLIDLFVKLKAEAVTKGVDMIEFRDTIAGQMAVFLGGGTDTSSTTISNILLELAKQPQIQDRLRQEIRTAFMEGNGSISYDTLTSMEYLKMVIDETLRIYPIFPLLERQYLDPKGTGKPYSLKPYSDFEIPHGMAVYISAFGLQYDPKYWPDPEKFDPERFSPENKQSMNPMIYLPFSSGPRNCIGARLGYLQVSACIVHVLKNHYVKVCPQTDLNPDFNKTTFFLQTKGGIHLEVIRDYMCKQPMA
ncbi:cytochrome P450 6g1 [Stomoxys calcitrans]|uniref:Cytochrome P450 n=1 Tax=Stomoxys calcitrans TaxID=35570 RepID=A0A1I8NVK2_STOCA|nr:cytochrome P450 6g1 [Stomoxys calcitrans]